MSNSALVFALSALEKANTANERIDSLPLPMVFKGTLGTGGTIETLPAASSSNEGFVYIVITNGTYAGQSAKAGDTFVSDGSSWVLVPSADEPSPIDDSVTSTALTWSSKKISDNYGVKSFTYTGDGNAINSIEFPVKPNAVIGIIGYYDTNIMGLVMPFTYGQSRTGHIALRDSLSSAATIASVNLSYNDNVVTIQGLDSARSCNVTDKTYTVYYI